MEKILYPSDSVRAIITGPSNSGKTYFFNKINSEYNCDFDFI